MLCPIGSVKSCPQPFLTETAAASGPGQALVRAQLGDVRSAPSTWRLAGDGDTASTVLEPEPSGGGPRESALGSGM